MTQATGTPMGGAGMAHETPSPNSPLQGHFANLPLYVCSCGGEGHNR